MLANIPQKIHFEVLVDEIVAQGSLLTYVLHSFPDRKNAIMYKIGDKNTRYYIGLYPGFLDVHGCICISILAHFSNQSTSSEE